MSLLGNWAMHTHQISNIFQPTHFPLSMHCISKTSFSVYSVKRHECQLLSYWTTFKTCLLFKLQNLLNLKKNIIIRQLIHTHLSAMSSGTAYSVPTKLACHFKNIFYSVICQKLWTSIVKLFNYLISDYISYWTTFKTCSFKFETLLNSNEKYPFWT